MKKLLVAFALTSLAAASAFARSSDSDVLLAPNGTLYSIESDFSSKYPYAGLPSGKVLQFSALQGNKWMTQFVPASLKGGINSDPSLAYDAETDSVFVFWQHSENRMSSELIFSTYHNMEWSKPISIDKASFNLRFNLRIAATRWVNDEDESGAVRRTRELVIHATWWEQTGYGEEAHYAMLTMDKGKVTNIVTRRLLDFVPAEKIGEHANLPSDFDRDLLRIPSMTPSATNDGVEIVFADWNSNNLQHVTVTPVRERTANGVIRVPGGVWHGNRPAPRNNIGENGMKVSTILSPGGTLAYYQQTETSIRYILLKEQGWSDVQSVSIGNEVSAELAVDALRRLVAAQ